MSVKMPREFIGTVYRSSRTLLFDGGSILRLLLHRVAAGDTDAFADLYRVLSAPILADVQASGIPADAADAVVAGVFVEVWTMARLHTGRRANIADWLARIVRRRCFERRQGVPSATTPTVDDPAWWSGVADRFDDEARSALAGLLDAAENDRRALAAADGAGWRHRPVIAVSPTAPDPDLPPVARRDTIRVPLARSAPEPRLVGPGD